MADVSRLGIEIDSDDIRQAIAALKELAQQGQPTEQSARRLENAFTRLQRTVIALNQGISLVSRTYQTIQRQVSALIQDYRRQEQAEVRLAAVLRATGDAAGYSAFEMQQHAAELQSLTIFGDEAIIEMQAVLATFRNVQDEVFRRTTEVALDLASVFGGDLTSQAKTLGMALENPIEGMSRLRRVGVSLSEQQREQIRVMQEAGDMVGAQTALLDVLEQQVGGTARAIGETATASFQRLSNAIGDTRERGGRAMAEFFQPFAVWLTENLQASNDFAASLRSVRDIVNDVGTQSLDELEASLAFQQSQVDVLEARLRSLQSSRDRDSQRAARQQEETVANAREELRVIQERVDAARIEDEARRRRQQEQDQEDREATERRKKEEAAQARILANQARLEQAYSQTHDGRVDALREEIAFIESLTFAHERNAEMAEVALAHLRDQLDILTRAPGVDLVERLEQERDALGMTSSELLRYRLAREGASEATIEAAIAIQEELELQEKAIEVRRSLITEEQRYAQQLELLNILRDAGKISEEEHATAVENLNDQFRQAVEETSSWANALATINDRMTTLAVDSFAQGVYDIGFAFGDGALAAKDFGLAMANVGRTLLNVIPRMAIAAGFQLLMQGNPMGWALIAGGISGTFTAGMVEGYIEAERSAMGNIFIGGEIKKFAKGSAFTNTIVNSPTLFPMANGAGLMGEAGPEAVMPLTRMPSGELGVRAEGSGGLTINIINNANAQVHATEKQGENGREVEIFIEGMVQNTLSNGGADRAMRNRYGVKPQGIRV
jgi:phage-related minor tail protein